MKKVLIVNANYYKSISANLVINCQKKLILNELKTSIINAPGCFEIPFLINKYIKKYDGFIALGCLIKGETPHFDLISKATIDGIMKLSIEHKKPIGNGIITCLSHKQAVARQKKGEEAAVALLSVLKQSKVSTK